MKQSDGGRRTECVHSGVGESPLDALSPVHGLARRSPVSGRSLTTGTPRSSSPSARLSVLSHLGFRLVALASEGRLSGLSKLFMGAPNRP